MSSSNKNCSDFLLKIILCWSTRRLQVSTFLLDIYLRHYLKMNLRLHPYLLLNFHFITEVVERKCFKLFIS